MSIITNAITNTAGSSSPSDPDNLQKAKTEQLKRQEKIEEEKQKSAAESPNSRIAPCLDEYIHEEPSASAGLYQLTKDENGTPKIIFDAPKTEAPRTTAENALAAPRVGPDQSEDTLRKPADIPQKSKDAADEPKDAADEPKDAADEPKDAADEPKDAADREKGGDEVCTVNTDKVDAEIKRLREKANELKQQIAQFSDDPNKQNQLKEQLREVEQELKQKDNDTYRREHSEVTYS